MKKIPKQIAEAPELMIGLDFFIMAFHQLSGDRQIGMGLGPIPYSSIHDFARINGLDPGAETQEFFHHIRQLDAEFLDYHTKKSEERKNQELSSRKK